MIYALRNDLTLLHVQDYNSGPIMGLDNQYHPMGGADFHIAMTDMLLTGFPVAGNTANMFPALSSLPGRHRPSGGQLRGQRLHRPGRRHDQALNCLTKGSGCGGYATHGTWPGLRGLMTWSINWDKYTNWEFQNNFNSYFGS